MGDIREFKLTGLEFKLELLYAEDKRTFEIYVSSAYLAPKVVLIAGVRGDDAIPFLRIHSNEMSGTMGVERLVGVLHRAMAMAQNEMAKLEWD